MNSIRDICVVIGRGLLCLIMTFILVSCATTRPPQVEQEAPVTRAEQVAAQNAEVKPEEKIFKRKVAIGRVSNETRYGRTFWRDDALDPLGKQVSDKLAAELISSKKFLIFERPDLGKLQNEQVIIGESDLVGVDALIIGSLTEFARNTTGETGFLSKTKIQTARAVVDIRLVDSLTGYAFFSATGTGEAQMESGEIAGFGSKADYDATLNDKAIAAAVADVIDELVSKLEERPWRTEILQLESGQVFISGGERMGIEIGDQLTVMQRGKVVDSSKGKIELPSTPVGEIKVISYFGDSELNEGSVATILSGNIVGGSDDLYVTE